MRTSKRVTGGWWIDESAPNLSGVLPETIDATAFIEWLGPELGRYRSAMQERAAVLPLAQERAEVRRTVRLLADAQAALRDLPLRTRAGVSTIALQYQAQIRTNWLELEGRVDADLTVVKVLLTKTEQGLSAATAKRGRKAATPRDQLLHVITARLRASGLRAAKAEEVAAQVLVRCKIAVPSDDDAAKRAARRGQKSKK